MNLKKVRVHKQVPTWDLYLVTDSGTKQIIRDAEEEVFLSKYFIGIENNIKKHPDFTPEKFIESYKKLWNKQGELRSFYTDSWGHKWICFPRNDKLLKYLKTKL